MNDDVNVAGTSNNENNVNENNVKVDSSLDTGNTPEFDSKKTRSKKWIGILIVAIIVLAAGSFFLMNKNGSSTDGYYSIAFSEDDVEYVPLMNGEVVSINDASDAAVTPDRKHLVYLKDEELYCSKIDKTEEKLINDKCEGFYVVKNDGFLYYTDTSMIRYTFSDGKEVELGDVKDYIVSRFSLNVAYSTADAVYMLRASESQPVKMGGYENDCELAAIDDDGKTVFWKSTASGTCDVYTYSNGEKSKIGSFELSSRYGFVSCRYNYSRSYFVFYSSSSDYLYYVNSGEEPVKVKLPDKGYVNDIYTEKCEMSYDDSPKMSGLYINYSTSDGNSIYYVNADGERDKIMSDIEQFVIVNKHLYYIDEDDNLRCAKISKEVLSDDNKITGDVGILFSESINGYLYFMKDVNSKEEMGELYVLKDGSDPIKIASDVHFSTLWDTYYMSGTTSLDGQSIVFYRDVKEIDGSYLSKGTMYLYEYKKSPIKISDDVIVGSENSAKLSRRIVKDSIVYRVKESSDDGTYYFFDGTSGKEIATN